MTLSVKERDVTQQRQTKSVCVCLCVCVFEGERVYRVGGGEGTGTSGKLLKGSRDNRAPFTGQQH